MLVAATKDDFIQKIESSTYRVHEQVPFLLAIVGRFERYIRRALRGRIAVHL
jgi:hypothetical protein